MSISLDKNRRTFRSDVKRRSGGRLPGIEIYDQGLDLKTGDVSRSCLPILGRSLGHEYSAVQTVYKSASDIDELGKNKTIDIQVSIGSSASYDSSGNFSTLVDQEFIIYNPEYQFDSSEPFSWKFKFVNELGVDPRLVYQENGLYNGYPGRKGNTWNANMHMHLLKPIPREFYHADFELNQDSVLQNYGAHDTTNNLYKIPIGLPSTAFPTDQPSDEFGTAIPVSEFDLSVSSVFQSLAKNPYWLYATITRALHRVLPSYIEILDPESENYLNISKEDGAFYLWDNYDLSDTSAGSPIRIKLNYQRNGVVQNPNSNAVNVTASGSDISIESWDFSVPHQWTRAGHRKIQRQSKVFYEDFRTDFLKQTEVRPIDASTASINFYSPQVSLGTSTPQFSAGVEISKYEETLSNSPALIDEVVTSELLSIRKTQSKQIVDNTHVSNHTYFEDIHYVDPDQQTHSQLVEKWPQWVDVNDHGGRTQDAFVAHLENMFDKRYSSTNSIKESPMSGRIDLFDRVQSYYSNMPETVLWNTRKSVSAQSFDLESIVIVKDKHLKKSEQIDIKKFEDLKGIRDEGEEEYHIIQLTSPGVQSMITNSFGSLVPTGTLPTGNYKSYQWKYNPNGDIEFNIKYKGGIATANFTSTSPNFPTQNTQNADWVYLKRVPAVSPGESIMFEDYFDQEEPAVLKYVEEKRWTRIDDEMMVWLTQKYWDDDNDASTIDVLTGRSLEIDSREWQQSDYIYQNTGHTTVHSSRVNGIIAQEHKR